jgi:hypothetical protein
MIQVSLSMALMVCLQQIDYNKPAQGSIFLFDKATELEPSKPVILQNSQGLKDKDEQN